MMSDLGKSLIILGLVIVAIGAVLMLSGKLPWLGKLPGDIYIKKENFAFAFPLTTCIIISAVISFVFWLLRR